MRLLLIHQAFVSPREAGGTRHYEFARRCLKEGHDMMIVASDLSYLTGACVVQRRKLVSTQIVDGVRILRAYTYPSLHRSFPWRVFSFLSFMLSSLLAGFKAGSVDVVMGTSPPIFQAFSAWLIAALRRKPFLLEIRDLWPEFAIGLGVLKNPLLIRFARKAEIFLYNRASHLLINSPGYLEHLISRGVPAGKISLIPNGVDPDMFSPEDTGAVMRSRWNLHGKFIVTYAGALGLANDIPTLLRTAQRLREHDKIHFLLIGDGMMRPKVEAMARELRLDNVTFIGAAPKSDMKQYLAAADVCVAVLQNIPMLATTYPNKVFDYMAAGRAVALGIAGEIRKVVLDAKAGICVEPGNDRQMAEGILKLFQNPEATAEAGRSGRRFVEKYFSRHSHARDFIALVLRLEAGGVAQSASEKW